MDCETCGKCANLKEKDFSKCENFYTLLIYSENTPGLLSQISAIFTRRQVNIESINVCASSTPGAHKYTITCNCTEQMVQQLTKQIEKRIDVLQAHYYTDDEIFIIETSLFKLSTPVLLKNEEISKIVRKHSGRIIEVNPTYAIVEKTGRTKDIIELYNSLNETGAVLQFARSGRICTTQSTTEHLDVYLAKREAERNK
ncbi:MAG: acetolactate synthase small subunit [Bacteroidaceae bacterium]|nr:acetolactate synthase small subunit [Bacteroidaceae bacterium]